MQNEEKNYGLNEFARDMRQISRSKGFENPKSIDEINLVGTKLLLVVCEVAEAFEEVRKSGDRLKFGEEIADVFIRMADMCHDLGIDIDAHVMAKIAKNRGRPYLHGKRA